MGIAERRSREKEQRATDIVDAAETVIFAKGYENATMDEIAEEAELSKGTLYLYFKTKEELYLAIAIRGNEILRKKTEIAIEKEKTGLDKVVACGMAYFDMYQNQRNYFDALNYMDSKELTPEMMHERHEAFQRNEGVLQLLAEIIEQGKQDGSIRTNVNAYIQSLLIWGQAMGVIQILAFKGCFLEENLDLKQEDMIEEFFITIRRSLYP
jgi:TetR/AcrR family transcriptional regulator